MNQSDIVKNGQQLRVPAGSTAIAQGDLVLVGGLGGEAWPVGTIDYAVSANSGTLVSATNVVSSAMPGSSRQPLARDRLGNIYLIGTNSSGRLVAYKRGPFGTGPVSAVLDATATSVNTAQLFQLSNGNFCCVYARAAGALYFVVFDSMLSLIAGPASVTTERASTNVVYHSSIALSGGGFAIAYQTSAGSAINLVTYSNAGSAVLAATGIQTLTGSAALEFIRLVQLSNGNLVCAFRGTMAANAFVGTSFVVVATSGANIVPAVNVDTVGTLGTLEVSALAGYFAVAVANGSNVVCAVYSNAGAVQGTPFSSGNTLNAGTYPQTRLVNDGTYFWLVYFSSVGNGLYVLGLAVTGATYGSASGLGSSTFSASTFALDADVVNGSLVALGASTLTAGQFWTVIGLPDASLGVSAPYARTSPTAFGSAAATSGSLWPRVMCSAGGLYRGSSPPLNQPVTPAIAGDFTVILAYDQQNVAGTFLGVVKVEPSAILGAALASVAGNQPGTPLFVNPGQGEYGTNAVAGTGGITFNHLSNSPGGTAGTVYTNGVALSGIATGVSSSSGGSTSTSALIGVPLPFAGPAANIPPNSVLLYGQTVSRTGQFAAVFEKIGTAWGVGDGSTTFQLPDGRGNLFVGLDNMGGTPAGRLTSTTMTPDGNTLGATGGTQTHIHTTQISADVQSTANGPGVVASFPNHTHGVTASSSLQPTLAANYIMFYA